MSALVCRDVGFGYRDTPIIESLDLTVGRGESMALLGLSGSGKTTLLNLVAGFEPIQRGSIDVDGRRVADPGRSLPPNLRSVGVVFQHHALWPHLSVVDTVAFPLRRAGEAREAARRAATKILQSLEIEHLAHRPADSLSGGQQQRVGVARALARRPALFLFDEPTAHLDAPLRATFQEVVAMHRAEIGAAALYATHDAGEALAVADRVGLIRSGQIVQTGSPDEIYGRPVDYPAALLTGPASLLVVGVETSSPPTVRIGNASQRIEAPVLEGEQAQILVRPEWASLGGPFDARVEERYFRGPFTDYLLETDVGLVLARQPGAPAARSGERCRWSLNRAWPLAGPRNADG